MMSDLKKFPKVRPIGHPETEGLTEDGTVYVLEKMDGANFRWGMRDGELVVGSRNIVYEDLDEVPDPFQHAVEYITDTIPDNQLLREDVTYFGEAMHPHTLEYDWPNVPDVLGFAVYDHEVDEFKSWPVANTEYDRVGIETVPFVKAVTHDSLDADYEIPDSAYRDGIAEGVVFWHKNGTRAKLRSEQFREKHDAPVAEPVDYEGHGVLVKKYCTKARIDKRINDLLDERHLTLGRGLMGEGLPQAVSRDIFEEHAHEIVGMNETVDLKDYRSLVAKRCLSRIDERMADNFGDDQ